MLKFEKFYLGNYTDGIEGVQTEQVELKQQGYSKLVDTSELTIYKDESTNTIYVKDLSALTSDVFIETVYVLSYTSDRDIQMQNILTKIDEFLIEDDGETLKQYLADHEAHLEHNEEAYFESLAQSYIAPDEEEYFDLSEIDEIFNVEV